MFKNRTSAYEKEHDDFERPRSPCEKPKKTRAPSQVLKMIKKDTKSLMSKPEAS